MMRANLRAVVVLLAATLPCMALAQAPKAVPATAPSEPDAIPLQAEANASPATENRSATALLPTRYPLPVTR